MATKPFKYQEMFPLGPDTTEYYHLTSDYVKVENWGGHEFLVVDPEALTVLTRQATHDNAFMLRREHNEMVAKILNDPEASQNDKFVALTILPGYRHSHLSCRKGSVRVHRLQRRRTHL